MFLTFHITEIDMPRNLDLTALRSFVAVADLGGVTRAAGMLNLTQSAVSMQLKRLEESLGLALLDRSGRTIALTPAGERLCSHGRRMIELNDDIFARMTDTVHEGTLVLGVPHDIIYPSVPQILQLFNAEYPRMRVQLLSSWTSQLKELFRDGKCDVILTTEDLVDAGGETLAEKEMRWYGAPRGTAWQRRPLPVASEPQCQFRRSMISALDDANVSWEMAVDSESTRTVEATVVADLAVLMQIAGTAAPQLEEINHGGTLPAIGMKKINLYVSALARSEAKDFLVELVRRSYRSPKLALTA
jgi:DNA-binding transcriptional LysR family regulator